MSRTVVELDPKFHPDGGRFLVKPYPKTTKYRRLKLSRQVVTRISAHVGERHLGADDLLFTVPADPPPRPDADETALHALAKVRNRRSAG